MRFSTGKNTEMANNIGQQLREHLGGDRKSQNQITDDSPDCRAMSEQEELESIKKSVTVVSPPEEKLYRGKIRKTRIHGKHQMAACCQCKKKRRKCDGGYPSCEPCVSTGVECTLKDILTGREIPRNYLDILETKIAHLETELEKSNGSIPNHMKRNQENPFSHESSSENSEGKSKNNTSKDNGLPLEVGYITLTAASEPRFIGASSAYSIARAMQHAMYYYEQKNPPEESDYDPKVSSQHSVENQTQEVTFIKPSFAEGHRLLKAYHYGVQCQYPFLDWKWISDCFEKVMNAETNEHEPVFFIYMIFAVASQLLEHSTGTLPIQYTRAYYDKAFEHIAHILEETTVRSVQAYLLLSVFSQKMPYGTSIWQTTGLAIRTSVALGLHRKPYLKRKTGFQKTSESDENLRTRIFWCAYSMERINGLVLGRPFGIADEDIDTPLPHTEEYAVAVHVFKLRILQSSLCSFVYKPRKLPVDNQNIESTRYKIMLELNDWKKTFPCKRQATTTWETDNWATISYHNSVLLLLRPVVLEVSKLRQNTPAQTIEWFRIFTQSTSAICLNYKHLHTKQKLSYTWLAMQCVFVAGISFLYCVWLDSSLYFLKWSRKSIIYETISACSNILYVLAERWRGAKMFRDSFERMSRAVLANVETKNASDDLPQNQEPLGVKTNSGFTPRMSIVSACQQPLENPTALGESPRSQNNVTTDGLSFAVPLSASNGSSPLDQNFADGVDLSSNLDTVWSFLDTTADNFLKDMFYDLEETLDI